MIAKQQWQKAKELQREQRRKLKRRKGKRRRTTKMMISWSLLR